MHEPPPWTNLDKQTQTGLDRQTKSFTVPFSTDSLEYTVEWF